MTPSLRQAAASALTLAVLSTGLVAVAPAASAAGCGGTRIDQMPMRSGKSTAGRVELWYSSARGGTNCVITYDLRDGSRFMNALLDPDDGGEWNREDYGKYTYYAGPVTLTRMAGKCINWGGEMYIGQRLYQAFEFESHCG